MLARPKLGDFSQEWQNARELQDADLAKKEERRDQARMEEKQETLGPALNPPPPPGLLRLLPRTRAYFESMASLCRVASTSLPESPASNKKAYIGS